MVFSVVPELPPELEPLTLEPLDELLELTELELPLELEETTPQVEAASAWQVPDTHFANTGQYGPLVSSQVCPTAAAGSQVPVPASGRAFLQ
jgi:hypothetical protein